MAEPATTGDGAEQLRALTEVARARGLHTLLIREPATLGWLLGCRSHVPNTLDTACFDVLVGALDGDAPTVTVVSNRIEAPRLRDTEFGGPSAPPIAEHLEVAWWEDRSSHFPTGAGVGCDRAWRDATLVATELAAARRVLTERQGELLAQVAGDTAQALTRVAVGLLPGVSEFEVAAAVSAELLAGELEPIVLMVAADGRDRRHRHPLPTGRTAEKSLLLVACARRFGLVASITRQVVFGSRVDDLTHRQQRYAALLGVEQAFLDASRPGARLGDVVRAGIDAYAAHGFAADEWTRHHQGGLSGWLPREFPASPGSDVRLAPSMVVAWNPSGDGSKVEDTALVTPTGVRPLVHDPDWPAVEVGGRLRPDLLVR